MHSLSIYSKHIDQILKRCRLGSKSYCDVNLKKTMKDEQAKYHKNLINVYLKINHTRRWHFSDKLINTRLQFLILLPVQPILVLDNEK